LIEDFLFQEKGIGLMVTEQPLSDDDRDMIDMYTADGLHALSLDEEEPPMAVVTAIGRRVDEERAAVKALPEDEYAEFILSMACLWGTQVCRAYKWEWVTLDYASGTSPAIVAPDRAVAIYPLFYFKDFIDDLERDTTIIVVFKMLDPKHLDHDLPLKRAGRYTTLS
jgi:hypothetical protein